MSIDERITALLKEDFWTLEEDELEEFAAETKQALYKDMVELIEDNIIYGNEQISKDELLKAIRKYYGVEE